MDQEWTWTGSGPELDNILGIAIGSAKVIGVEYQGTMFVCCSDDDWIGAVFSFQVCQEFFILGLYHIEKILCFYRILLTSTCL